VREAGGTGSVEAGGHEHRARVADTPPFIHTFRFAVCVVREP
jgi:hypothetical protein